MFDVEPSYLPDHLRDDKVEPDFEGAFNTLGSREVEIIKYRFGFDTNPKTFKQIGVIFGISGGRIRQILIRTLSKLRHPSRSRLLKGSYYAIR
jgi:RNA polymerase primary sigma factor